jgi:hypothetical protein
LPHPSLRTGLADFPHPALRSVVLPQRGLKESYMDIPKPTKTINPKHFSYDLDSHMPHPTWETFQHTWQLKKMLSPIHMAGTSQLLSPRGHSQECVFISHNLHASTFLHPFTPRALPRFFATMGALTPDRGALRTLARGNELPTCPGQVSLLNTARPSMHSVSKHLSRPAIASLLPTQRDRLPGSLFLVSRSGLRLESAGSSLRSAESSSSSYGLHVRLRLLPTPTRVDAVTFDYRERASPGWGLSPLRSRLLAGARIPAFAGMTHGANVHGVYYCN